MNVQLSRSKWIFDESVSDTLIIELIKKNKQLFSGNGGDTKNVLDRCKISAARRGFSIKSTRIITAADVKNGFASFVESKTIDNNTLDNTMMYI
jgi:hypothetical protein